jgi:soluble P-type ATPase
LERERRRFSTPAAVEGAADDVVAHAREILHAAAADEDHGVLLELVAFVGDVGDDFLAVRQAHLGDLTLSNT